jgi:quinol monooxygenase YgiN
MKRMIRYTLKPDRVAENEGLVEQVFEELRRTRPPGLRYAAFKLPDGVSFMHIVSYDSEAHTQSLSSLPAFKAFVAGVKDRCVEPPVTVDLKEVGSYGFFET